MVNSSINLQDCISSCIEDFIIVEDNVLRKYVLFI